MILVATQVFCHVMDHITGHLNYLINSNECPSLRISKDISDYSLRLNPCAEREFLRERVLPSLRFLTHTINCGKIFSQLAFLFFVFHFEIIIDSQEILKTA